MTQKFEVFFSCSSCVLARVSRAVGRYPTPELGHCQALDIAMVGTELIPPPRNRSYGPADDALEVAEDVFDLGKGGAEAPMVFEVRRWTLYSLVKLR